MVLVTVDQEFKARGEHSEILQKCGAEVIVFLKDPKGLESQQLEIETQLRNWIIKLSKYVYGYRVWEQHSEGRLVLTS